MSNLRITVVGSPEHTEQITKKFKDKFQKARTDQRFEPMVMVSKHIKANFQNQILVIQLFRSYEQQSFGLLVYDNEPTILGKSLQLLVHLEEKYELYKYLQYEGIVRIIITTSPDLMDMNDSNKWTFDTKESLGLIRKLLELKERGKFYFQQGIHALISDSRNQ